jgi:hypothetical protein
VSRGGCKFFRQRPSGLTAPPPFLTLNADRGARLCARPHRAHPTRFARGARRGASVRFWLGVKKLSHSLTLPMRKFRIATGAS